jgi:nitrite reductase/ring-hydroxylating ferredoxin subunit
LHDGEIVWEDGIACMRCPWHGSTFRLADGAVEHGPATARQPRLEVALTRGVVQVRLPEAGAA